MRRRLPLRRGMLHKLLRMRRLKTLEFNNLPSDFVPTLVLWALVRPRNTLNLPLRQLCILQHIESSHVMEPPLSWEIA